MKRYFVSLSFAALICAAGSLSFAQTKNAGWVSIFNGKDLKGWHGFNKNGPVKNWKV